jgi:hypothetical protein
VSQLDTDLLALAVGELNDLLEGGDLRVLPETNTAGSNTTLGDNTGSLNDDHSRAPLSNATVVGDMPGCHVAILSTVLAHGRHLLYFVSQEFNI